MRIVDLHCYPGTREWIACQGPYFEALAKYWKRDWAAKEESEVVKDFAAAGVDACLVALDLETTIGTKPVGNDYVHAMWQRHRGSLLHPGPARVRHDDLQVREIRRQPVDAGRMRMADDGAVPARHARAHAGRAHVDHDGGSQRRNFFKQSVVARIIHREVLHDRVEMEAEEAKSLHRSSGFFKNIFL